ncbi:MAG: hypothetical protein GX075_12320 [Firmicutes bacterium]|nr:hypothetical protein [Bacillota bacterium]
MTELYRDLAIRLGKAGAVIELNSYGVRGSKLGDVGVYPDRNCCVSAAARELESQWVPTLTGPRMWGGF